MKRNLEPIALNANVTLDDASPTRVRSQFRELLSSGHKLAISGLARKRQADYLPKRYPPQFSVQLFDYRFYLSSLRESLGFTFFVAFVQPDLRLTRGGKRLVYPRIFYKDSSLIWRSATHYIRTENEHWIGKGAIKPTMEDGREVWYSAEETTDLPLELMAALDHASRLSPRATSDHAALGLILRNAPENRVEPYQDFEKPRQRAANDPKERINNAKPVAWFDDPTDPRSLQFASGFAPDFARPTLGVSKARSRLYGGAIRKIRILSENQRIQYLFIHGPRHVWIIPPQSLSPTLMSYGVRPIDVEIDDRVCLPGFEFHYVDDSVEPPVWHSQIPPGFAGSASRIDPGRADTRRWTEAMPVIAEFRRRLT